MAPRWLLHLGLCCLLLGAVVPSAVIPGAAAPPPRPLCDACGDAFERTAEAHGVALTVERSTATVAVHENGSATWVVRNHLADSPDDSSAVERLRSNASLRAGIGDRAMRNTEFIGANVSADGVLSMRYRDSDFARSSVGGTLRSGEFTREYGYRSLTGLGADRLVVVAPEDMRIGWTVSGATISDDGRRTTLTRLDEFGFVTFVPSDAMLGPLWSALAVGSLVGPAIATNALVYVALPTALFAVLIAAAVSPLWLDAVVERVRGSSSGSPCIIGGLGALALLAGGGVSLLGGPAAPFFGVGLALASLGVALSRPNVRERATYRTLVVGAALGGLLAASATVVGAAAFDGNGPTRSLFRSLPFLAPVFALLPAGYAAGRGNRRLAVGTAAVGFVLAMLPVTPFTSPSLGLGVVLVFVAAAYAAGIAVVGMPLLAVGASLATAQFE